MEGEIVLHPFQRRAKAAAHSEWLEHQATLIVMATGLGKTITFASILKDRAPLGRAMVLAHREELISQAVQKIKRGAGLECDVEMASLWADGGYQQWHAPVVVSTVQTQVSGRSGKGRMTRFDPSDFATIIVDEAHHATSDTYRRILDHYGQNKNAKILGVTATPNRSDEEALGQIFQSVAYNYGLAEAIPDGWLCPIRQFAMPIDGLDLSDCHTTAGDLNGADLAREMERQKPLLGLANGVWREADGRKTLLFAASVEHARLLCGIFNTDYKSGCARFVSGKTPRDERRNILRSYAQGEFQILCNCAVFTEGFDDPTIEVVVPRPTKSTPFYIQQLGRGTRTLPGILDGRVWEDDQRELGIEGEQEAAALRRKLIAESAKPHCEVLDLYCQSGRHRLVTAVDALAGNVSDEVLDRAARLAREDGGEGDPAERIKRAQAAIASEAEQRLQRQAVKATAQYRKTEVDPFGRLGIERPRTPGWEKGRKPSKKMLGLLNKQGIKTDGMTFSEAGQLIGELKRRWDAKLVSFKQAGVLTKAGFRGDMKASLAKPILDTLFANNFRWPKDRPRPNSDGSAALVMAAEFVPDVPEFAEPY